MKAFIVYAHAELGSFNGALFQTAQDTLRAAILQSSLGFDPTGDRAWPHSLPAHSGCALPLRGILFTRSQRVQIAGKIVPQNPADEPAEKLLEGIRSGQNNPPKSGRRK